MSTPQLDLPPSMQLSTASLHFPRSSSSAVGARCYPHPHHRHLSSSSAGCSRLAAPSRSLSELPLRRDDRIITPPSSFTSSRRDGRTSTTPSSLTYHHSHQRHEHTAHSRRDDKTSVAALSAPRLPTPPLDMYGMSLGRRGSHPETASAHAHHLSAERAATIVNGNAAPLPYGMSTLPTNAQGSVVNGVPTAFYPYNGGDSLANGHPSSPTKAIQQHHQQHSQSQVPTVAQVAAAAAAQQGHTRSRSAVNFDSIAPKLQIPRTINISQGSLPELAAQITCLLWFESSKTLQQAEDAAQLPLSLVPLAKDAIPSIGFRKWVTTMLSTTQVAQHVILLALLFIYRLKKLNPTVKGKPGSEYRLLTVALMLGNKFLDDNTYTNKTWAEVSGISVTEVHVMEVEFLSNMRYSLFTTEEQWKEWHAKLGKFASYIDRASRPLSDPSRKLPGPTTPTVLGHPHSTFPSPPGSTHTSPPYHTGGHPSPYGTLPNPVLQPFEKFPELDLRAASRKRSIDDSVGEPQPPAKRMAHAAVSAYHTHPTPVSSSSPLAVCTPTTAADSLMSVAPAYATSTAPRLPLPTTAQQQQTPLSAVAAQNLVRPGSQLPPLPDGTKAMATVFPTPVAWSQPTSSPSMLHPANRPQLHAQTTQLLDRASRPSPFHVSSAAASPTVISYPSTPAAATPTNRSSPSHFLIQRSSPYRPVRQVNTLLQNPPSGAVYSLPSIPVDRMHYRPLGKTLDERRTGPLPYFPFDTWSDPHQPGPQQGNAPAWPSLPQPQSAYQ